MSRKAISETDRRGLYTKKVIREAFVRLMKEKDPEKITVAEICRSADINRGTFYLHYDNSLDVLHAMEDEVFETIKDFMRRSLADEGKRQALSDSLFSVFYSSEEMKTISFTRRLNDKICAYAQGLVAQLCVQSGKLTQREAELFAAFIVNACFAASQLWLEKGYTDLKQESAFVNKMVEAVFSAVIDPQTINQMFAKLF